MAIELEPLPPPPANPNPAPVDTPVGRHPWAKSCGIHRACERVARTIAACPAGANGLTVDVASALPADGRVVSVQGPLRLGDGSTTLMGCSVRDPVTDKPLPVAACCNNVTSQILIGEANGKVIALEKSRCFGDESRLCCDLVARGQPVVVTGKLLPEDHQYPGQQQLKLGGDVKVCALPAPAPPQP